MLGADRPPVRFPTITQTPRSIRPCLQSERFQFWPLHLWRSPAPSLVKTTNATARAEHAATPDTRAKGVIPVRTASPTSTSAELPAGECAVTDGALAQNGLGQCGGRQRNSVVEAIP